MAVFETLAYHDLSLSVKFGVQFGLFGGAILNLGTKYHHDTYLTQNGHWLSIWVVLR
jgi:acyl-CoA oxidase